jgi:1,2-dihydroxy-3-keto-5-methylthiopentene dioxygenase
MAGGGGGYRDGRIAPAFFLGWSRSALTDALTQLTIHRVPPQTAESSAATGDPSQGVAPNLVSDDIELIIHELAVRGVALQRWPARAALSPDASQEEILAAYGEEIARVQEAGRCPTVDAIRMTPDHPDRKELRLRFLAEHTHAEDEVRFFVEGRGLFCLHIGDEVLQLLCERNDWIAVPAGTKHWFDMGEEPSFCALRFFHNSEGWVAQFTGDPIAGRYPLLGMPNAPV